MTREEPEQQRAEAYRNQVLAHIEAIADFSDSIQKSLAELKDMGVTAEETMQLLDDTVGADGKLIDHIKLAQGIFWPKTNLDTAYQGLPVDPSELFPSDDPKLLESNEARRMRQLIERLFAEAPKLTKPDGSPRDDQSPALECGIVLKSGAVQLQGALSTTPEGTLRMLVPTRINEGPARVPKMILVEHFFDYEEILDIALIREMSQSSQETSRIVTQ